MYEFIANQIVGINGLINLSNVWRSRCETSSSCAFWRSSVRA
jgi:hypothetical protein